ncbi:MAG: GFA family protein [Myxococcota bacterium]
MTDSTGRCHCGAVRFRARHAATHLVRCNCSICRAKGALLLSVGEVDHVEILSGATELTAYRFNSQRAEHLFCRRCGIHPFHRPRLDPSRWSVNARCLDGGLPDLPIEDFDGRNWEAAIREEGGTEGARDA